MLLLFPTNQTKTVLQAAKITRDFSESSKTTIIFIESKFSMFILKKFLESYAIKRFFYSIKILQAYAKKLSEFYVIT